MIAFVQEILISLISDNDQIAFFREVCNFVRFLTSENNAGRILWSVVVNRACTTRCVASECLLLAFAACFACWHESSPSQAVGDEIFYRVE